MKYHKNLKLGTLNVCSLVAPGRFEGVEEVTKNLDILVISETKLDSTFPTAQFVIPEFSKPYRYDRNRNGGGVLIYVRNCIASKQLHDFNITGGTVEGVFVEFKIKNEKWLLFGLYHPPSQNDKDFINFLTRSLDFYQSYENFLLVGDFNIQEEETILKDFLEENFAKNLVKEPTCFKNQNNPSKIDLIITNKPRSCLTSFNVCTGLSDFHKMPVVVFRAHAPKSERREITYRNYRNFDEELFRNELRIKIDVSGNCTYDRFESVFLQILEKHAPLKKVHVRANSKPYVTKKLRKAMMDRSRLEKQFYKNMTPMNRIIYRKQKNYVTNLYKKERKKYYDNLDINQIVDNKKFWKNIKPLFTEGSNGGEKITIIDDNKVITSDIGLCNVFNDFFKNAVNNLNINDNRLLLNNENGIIDPIEGIISKFKDHPSIRDIKNHVIPGVFKFSSISKTDIETELSQLNASKTGMFSSIPAKILKVASHIISEELCKIWNQEFLLHGTFPGNLKLADITPIHKKLETILKENYRNVSILPAAAKVFERIMFKQISAYIESRLSKFLCGYRKGYSTQYALLRLIEKWKRILDAKGYAGVILLDLSKAFDTINHDLLIAKLHAYGFEKDSLLLIKSYLSGRLQRTKINCSYSNWAKLFAGVPQGSVLGPLLFNIYLNDLFFNLKFTEPCNFADDTSPSACDFELGEVIWKLENDTYSAIIWFENNYMKLNAEKCKFLLMGNKPQEMFLNVEGHQIWESKSAKLLGIEINNTLNFSNHLIGICVKTGQKITAMRRINRYMTFQKKRTIFKALIESQFGYCPLVLMFHGRTINNRINSLQERALRIVYGNYDLTFDELLRIDGSFTFHERNLQRLAKELFKHKLGVLPEIATDFFSSREPVRSTRNDNIFQKFKSRTVQYGDYSLRNFGQMVWEIIPNDLKYLENLTEFERKIKVWRPEGCPCRLCKTYISGVGFLS